MSVRYCVVFRTIENVELSSNRGRESGGEGERVPQHVVCGTANATTVTPVHLLRGGHRTGIASAGWEGKVSMKSLLECCAAIAQLSTS